ncbi:expressed unknown protein [Seminavis robusta]|uniref:Uncharacterized protein n=1 Tax=Seminavis robusta TaxID=568900 RepID=A0A9N8HAM8_9STRA|nr:expressed unknown protein [Seminavis robusta]|eukprot:Sro247_g098100.1 n/a (280) ;mRNA; f:40215-41054
MTDPQEDDQSKPYHNLDDLETATLRIPKLKVKCKKAGSTLSPTVQSIIVEPSSNSIRPDLVTAYLTHLVERLNGDKVVHIELHKLQLGDWTVLANFFHQQPKPVALTIRRCPLTAAGDETLREFLATTTSLRCFRFFYDTPFDLKFSMEHVWRHGLETNSSLEVLQLWCPAFTQVYHHLFHNHQNLIKAGLRLHHYGAAPRDHSAALWETIPHGAYQIESLDLYTTQPVPAKRLLEWLKVTNKLRQDDVSISGRSFGGEDGDTIRGKDNVLEKLQEMAK